MPEQKKVLSVEEFRDQFAKKHNHEDWQTMIILTRNNKESIDKVLNDVMQSYANHCKESLLLDEEYEKKE